MQIIFTEIARASLKENLHFLEQVWTAREIHVLLNDIEGVLDDLKSGKIRQFQKSALKTRSALIGRRHVRMFFRKSENTITVLLFFDVRQDPRKIIDLLK